MGARGVGSVECSKKINEISQLGLCDHVLSVLRVHASRVEGGHHIKTMECSRKILKRIRKMYQDSALWAWFEMFFTHKREQF